MRVALCCWPGELADTELPLPPSHGCLAGPSLTAGRRLRLNDIVGPRGGSALSSFPTDALLMKKVGT